MLFFSYDLIAFIIVPNHSSLMDLLPTFNECVDAFLEGLRPHADGKTGVFMKEAFHEMAMDVIKC